MENEYSTKFKDNHMGPPDPDRLLKLSSADTTVSGTATYALGVDESGNVFESDIKLEPGKAPYLDTRKSKYFTPALEDLRVGYECYFYWGGDDYQAIILTADNLPAALFAGNIKNYKTSYLTKEHVIADGWKQGLGKNDFWKGDASVSFLEGHSIIISQYQTVSFCGECKDINTLRYICELLKIPS